MNKIIESWEYTWYVQPLFEVLLLVTFAYVVLKRSKNVSLRLLPVYLGSFILFRAAVYVLSVLVDDSNDHDTFILINSILNYLISLIEFVTIFWFMYHETRSEKLQQAVWILGVIGILIYLFRMAQVFPLIEETGTYLIHRMYLLESGLLFVMGSINLASLFHEETEYDLPTSPAFWIFCGIMICMIGSFPMRIVLHYFFLSQEDVYRLLTSSIYSCYIVLIIMIFQGYRYVSPIKIIKK